MGDELNRCGDEKEALFTWAQGVIATFRGHEAKE